MSVPMTTVNCGHFTCLEMCVHVIMKSLIFLHRLVCLVLWWKSLKGGGWSNSYSYNTSLPAGAVPLALCTVTAWIKD